MQSTLQNEVPNVIIIIESVQYRYSTEACVPVRYDMEACVHYPLYGTSIVRYSTSISLLIWRAVLYRVVSYHTAPYITVCNCTVRPGTSRVGSPYVKMPASPQQGAGLNVYSAKRRVVTCVCTEKARFEWTPSNECP